jgi:hypothetical protein
VTDRDETASGPADDPVRETGTSLFAVKGGVSADELAALVAVVRATNVGAARQSERQVRSEWSAHHRRLRGPHTPGPGGWRASAQPR